MNSGKGKLIDIEVQIDEGLKRKGLRELSLTKGHTSVMTSTSLRPMTSTAVITTRLRTLHTGKPNLVRSKLAQG
jgi:hypothetical protein